VPVWRHRSRPRALAVLLLLLCLLARVAPGGSLGAKGQYMGGTLAGIPSGLSGRVHISDPDVFVFEAGRAALEIPYQNVNYLEYGQQAGRRNLLGATLSPLFLLSKSRKHFLTVSYKDSAGRQQAVVFQIDKKNVRSVLAGLEARTGLKVDYQDVEARKSGG
jgi:hypothetical protein